MPSEHLQSQSQAQVRPSPSNHRRSNSSIHSQTDSPATTPPQHGKPKAQKHVVGGGRNHAHARVPSSKSVHKLAKAHANEGSHDNLKKLGRNSSATHLKKNGSHVSLKRNQSSSDVRRPKSSQSHTKRPASVHFEIGDTEDAWEEASSSASPVLSRSASRPNSAKQSASNSQPQSPQSTTFKTQPTPADRSGEKPVSRHTADAKVITERLLQRTPSLNTTQMSLATATPATTAAHSPDSLGRSHGSTVDGTPRIGSKDEMVSRFVNGSGTPSDSQHFLQDRKITSTKNQDDMKRAQSMGNLTRQDSEREDEERALAPRSRKSSTSNAYNPPQQSRTQQKLWLQRASSAIEPQQMVQGVAINGLGFLHGGMGGTPLVGAGYDGRDPRIKQQLERTGLEYLVVRRHQDPIAQALKRLSQLPGADKNRRIPPQRRGGNGDAGRRGLSSSIKEARMKENAPNTTGDGGSSFEAAHTGSHSDAGMSGRRDDEDGISAVLRSLWEKNVEFSSSAD